MFDCRARKFTRNITVLQLCTYLMEHVPSNAVVHICGDNYIYFHQEEDGSVFCLDNNSLSDLPEYDGCEPEELCFREQTVSKVT